MKPKVTSMWPNFGWTNGGSKVSLSISDLGPFSLVSCSFGDLDNFIKALQVNDTTVTCRLPPLSENNTMKQSAPLFFASAVG